MILGRFRVSGHSMEPYLKEGDQVLAFRFSGIKKGDVVVFRYKSKVFIKRVDRITDGSIFVCGDNKKDSLEIGKVSKNDIIGKVVWKMK